VPAPETVLGNGQTFWYPRLNSCTRLSHQKTPMPQLTGEVETLASKVTGHLAKMGFKS
jgi:hypothetical protein